MADLYDLVLLFLWYSSLQILLLGGMTGVAIRIFKIRGTLVCNLSKIIIFLPLLTVAGIMIPHSPLQFSAEKIAITKNTLSQNMPAAKKWEDSRASQYSSWSEWNRDDGMYPPQPAPFEITQDQNKFRGVQALPSGLVAKSPSTSGTEKEIFFKALFFWAWVSIAGIMLLYLGSGIMTLYRKIRSHAAPVNDTEVTQLVSVCCSSTGLATMPEVRSGQAHSIPFVFGFLRPVIVVPATLLDPQKREELRYTLLHELEHIRRNDSLWLPFERIMHFLYFFHPVMHWTVRVLNKEREFLCDQNVVKVTRCKTEYAEFLLNRVWEHSQEPVNACALPFVNSTVKVSNRVKQILTERNKTMLEKVRELVIAGVLIAIVIPLAILSSPAQEKAQGTAATTAENNIFVEPSDLPGDYYLLADVVDIERVKVVLWTPESKGVSMFLNKGTQWDYDPSSRIIKIKVPVDNSQQRILVYAKQVVPWQFKAKKPLKKDSVQILIGSKICEQGKDFTVDEPKGIIKINAGLCQNNPPCTMYYRFDIDNARPERYAQGTRDANGELISKDIFDPVIYKKFMKENVRGGWAACDDFDPTMDSSRIVGTNAIETGEPLVFELDQPFQKNGLMVGIGIPNNPGETRWLKRDKDYTYNEDNGQITFIGNVPMDADKGEWVFVAGIPRQDIFLYKKALAKDSITVTVNDKPLKEGGEFAVDYEKGIVRVKKAEINDKSAKYKVSGPGRDFFDLATLLENQKKSPRKEYVPSPDHDPDIDFSRSVGTNAMETDKPLVFEIYQPFQKKGLEVGISSHADPTNIRWVKRDKDFTYDEDLGQITFIDKVPMDPDKGEYIFVSGIPRQDIFLFKESLPKGSVTITLNDSPLKEGSDFTVDYEKGIVRVSNPEINKKSALYKVSGPGKDFIDRASTIKKQAKTPQKEYVPSPDADPTINHNKTIGMDAAPTKDPKVFSVLQPCQTKGMVVAVASKTESGQLNWIKRGVDYTYEEETGKITLLKEITFKENEYLFVSGIPLNRNVFNLRGDVIPGQIKISIDDKQLKEGEDFKVDYAKNQLTILVPNFEKRYFGTVKITSGDNTILDMIGKKATSTATTEKKSN